VNKAKIVKGLKKALPYVLSGLSVVGVVATAIFSAKATAKALEQAEERDDTWKCYIPTALTIIATAALIIGNGVLNHKQQASLMSAYALLSHTYRQYRNKVREEIGAETDEKIVTELAVTKANRDICVQRVGLVNCTTLEWGVDEGEVEHTFMEAYTGELFTTTINKVLQAELAISNDMSQGKFVCVNDFRRCLGLEEIDGGDLKGWCECDGYTYIEFNHYKATIEDSDGHEPMEVLVIDYEWLPETEDYLENEL
jgi:hypothetical protein